MDPELTSQVRQAAQSLRLSMADVMRQSIQIGLPKLTEALAQKEGRITNVPPMTKAELKACYETPDDDAALIQEAISKQAPMKWEEE